jgi:hypothetical protein
MGRSLGRRREKDAVFEVRKEAMRVEGVSAEEAAGVFGVGEIAAPLANRLGCGSGRPFRILGFEEAVEHRCRRAFKMGFFTLHDGPFRSAMTDNNFLQLPQSALTSIIVGCQGSYDAVRNIVAQVQPALPVKKAIRVPNRFELQIA